MNNDTTIYGYVGDGVVFHPGCTATGAEDHAEGRVRALFSWDDNGYGLICDKCSEYIFEPYEREDMDSPGDDEPEVIYPSAFWPVDHEEGE